MIRETAASIRRKRCNTVAFSDVAILAYFECNGNVWQKLTTRTAYGVWPAILPKWAYFRQTETCHTVKDEAK